jgi:predicted Zn finger-like uncharacterized protein
MSLATRCPACGTIFRVVQDQLKVSEGWVRCGQCHEVFHGIEALFDLDSDPAIAARRAAARAPVAPPPTRVFADARASAPIPMPTPPAPAPSQIAIPARPPAPAPQSVPATPSAFGASDYPPAAPATRPGYTGFTPASHPPPPSPIPPVATRGTIAPRFAARLAEESARAQAAAPSPIPSAWPPTPTPAPAAPAPFGSTLARHAEPTWQSPPAPVPAPTPSAFSAPPFVASPPPAPEAPVAYAPTPAPMAAASAGPTPAPAPVRVEPPLVTPIASAPAPIDAPPSASELASTFAAPTPEHTPPAGAAPAFVREPGADIGGSTMPSMLAPDAADAVEDARAGPPTLASMLPEDAGEWPPRRKKRRAPAAAGASTEVALVDKSKDPRFLREAKSGARWRRPWVRAVLGVALLLLIVAAVGQVAWPQRDTLAARWPASLPAWQWLCEQASCRIEAPRAIASLALDGSSLTRTDTEHVLLFSADLHNRADHEVRVPSFDVTFMDLNGEIVARKVLTPEQLGIRQAALPAEGELHVHARLQVGSLAASGFQADLFYP